MKLLTSRAALMASVLVMLAAQRSHAATGGEPASPASASGARATEAQPETFFAAPTRVRLIAGPWTRLTLLGGSDLAVFAGGGGGLLFFDHLLLMGYGGSISSRTAPADHDRKVAMAGYGAQISWIVAPRSRLHINVGALIGGMSATVTAQRDANDTATLSFLNAEPHAEVEASLYTGLRVFLGAGYRIAIGDAARAGVDSGYLRGPVLEFGFRMGN